MQVKHVRSGKMMRLASPQQFMARERSAVEEAWPGDVIGVMDRGTLRIGDTLSTDGDLEFADALSDETTGTEYRVTVPVGIAGMPLGWLVVFAAGVAVVGVFAAASRWRGARLP